MWLAQCPVPGCGILRSLPVSSDGLPWGIDHSGFDGEYFNPTFANDGKDVGMGDIDSSDVGTLTVLIAPSVRDVVNDVIVFDTARTIWYSGCSVCRRQNGQCDNISFLRAHLSCRWVRRCEFLILAQGWEYT